MMIPARYRWQWNQPDEEQARQWSSRLNIPLLAARVLSARGMTEAEAAELFRPAEEAGLENPMLLKGMPDAVNRIRQAISSDDRIRVYGDYDADGVTSTALMTRLLTMLGARFDTYIPHRSLEGYGLNLKAIDLAAEAGVNLIITVDNGISAVEQIAYARMLGIDVVVTDHHEPPPELPQATALVNPKQPGCPYPNKGLCGAGVVFKIVHALLDRPVLEWSDLAAIGTIADLMPLVGENRLIVRMGLAQMRTNPAVGIRALAAICKVEPADLTSGRIGFALGPRLNAAGRLDRADGALRLLTTEDAAEAELLARELDRLNAERQQLVEETIEEAEQLWLAKKQAWERQGEDGPNVIVLSNPGWHAGIAGLVASKLVERHYRPAIILAEDSQAGTAKGSARSIDGFDLHAALSACAELMLHFGGHQAAAGMTIQMERVSDLEKRLHRLADDQLKPEDWLPKKRADLSCTLEETTLEAAEALGRLEPFGNGHPAPRLMIEGVDIRECRILGKEGKHVRLTVSRSGKVLEAIGFGMSGLADQLPVGRKLDLLGELAVNEWNGRRRVQFTLQDVRSDEWLWIDRREANDRTARRELEELAAADGAGLILLCASSRLADELSFVTASYGSIVCAYENTYATADPQAAQETAVAMDPSAVRSSDLPLRKLALFGLPDNDRDIRLLKQRLLDGEGWASIHLFADRTTEARQRPLTLERSDFGRIYKLFREQREWTDGPEGCARRVSEKSGQPLAAVRLAEEVFTELGLIRVRGAARAVVSDPPKRNLEDSPRYQRMLRQAEAASFPDWTLEQLKRWEQRIRRSDEAHGVESEA